MENKNIYSKLLAVQKEVEPIKKTEDNPFFKSKYFDVNAILSALKPILNKYGLVLIQPIVILEGKNVLKTLILDADGNDVAESDMTLPDNLKPQEMGSAITYYRRYALQSLFALEAQDDDANLASNKTVTYPKPGEKKGGIVAKKDEDMSWLDTQN
jgi:ERF superfamily protein